MTIGLFWTIFAGFIAGIIMNGFVPMKRLKGLKGTAVLCLAGIAGALAASFAGQALHLWDREQLGAFVAAVVGAAVLLGALAYFSKKSPPELQPL